MIPRVISFSLGLLAFASALFFAKNVFAGVNIESRRANIEKPGVFGDIKIASNLSYGNVNLASLGTGGVIGFKNNNHVLLGVADFNLATDFDKRLSNNEMAHLRYSTKMREYAWFETFQQVEANEFKMINLRYLIGAGFRIYAIEKERIEIIFGTGYMAEHERLSNNVIKPYPSEAVSRLTWQHRWNKYFTVRFGDNISFQTTAYFQSRFDRWSDIHILNENTLQIPLSDKFRLEFDFSLNVDTEPPQICSSDKCTNISPVDLGTNFGMIVTW